MSDPKDIVGKADAFLGRYRAAAAPDVPVLTEVVDASKPPAAPPALTEAELRGIEHQVTQRVLEAIQPAVSGLLEQTLGRLAEQYRAQVDAVVRDAVAKAVEREVQQLRQSRPAGR